jgi:hypothetical protein
MVFEVRSISGSLFRLENLGLVTLAKHRFGGYDQTTLIGGL